jgi:hypothetical protein
LPQFNVLPCSTYAFVASTVGCQISLFCRPAEFALDLLAGSLHPRTWGLDTSPSLGTPPSPSRFSLPPFSQHFLLCGLLSRCLLSRSLRFRFLFLLCFLGDSAPTAGCVETLYSWKSISSLITTPRFCVCVHQFFASSPNPSLLVFLGSLKGSSALSGNAM